MRTDKWTINWPNWAFAICWDMKCNTKFLKCESKCKHLTEILFERTIVVTIFRKDYNVFPEMVELTSLQPTACLQKGQWWRVRAGGICPDASRGGAETECGYVLRPKISKNCKLCWDRDGRGRKNYVRRKMHISDVISSISRSSKCTKIVDDWASPQTLLRVYSTPPDLLSGYKGAYL